MTKAQKALFEKTYLNCIKHLENAVEDYGASLIITMQKTVLKTFEDDQDFIDFAKQGFLRSVKRYYDEHYATEAAVQGARSQIKYGVIDDETEEECV